MTFSLFIFTLVTVGELIISQIQIVGEINKWFGKFGIFGQVPDVTSSRPAYCVTLPTS